MCLIGEWWINAVTILPVVRDQIHVVVGQVSLLVASIEPSALSVIMEIPCLGVALDFAIDSDVGGLTGCVASA